MHDFEFDLSRSLKIKYYGAIRKPTYDFLFVNNSKYNVYAYVVCSVIKTHGGLNIRLTLMLYVILH